MSDMCCLLTDNGSFRAEATLSLRSLAERLGEKVGQTIYPVSLLHSTKVSPAKLNDIPAEIFEPFILKKREEGINRFLVTPMFFGPSAAIKEYMPQRVEALRAEGWDELEVRIAPCVVEPLDPSDTRMAQILVDQIQATRAGTNLKNPAVAVVDHGAPRIKVTEVRNHLADQVRSLLPKEDYPLVTACSMERREGDEYAYNEPLLENIIGSEGYRDEVIVSMLFASPGRHAGPGGDVAQICKEAAGQHPGLAWEMTDLVATHDGIIDILAERFHQGEKSEPVRWIEPVA
ncbi:MAG: cobalamin biosynthesis protein CbiX [Verrucomicrobiota bacterium JB023]|nr:cobalamin biosynthesis protein CbiX [Verrucomicrobiota bacterium JB023]